MGACVSFINGAAGTSAVKPSGSAVAVPIAFYSADATVSADGVMSCASGTHLVLTVSEVAALKANVPIYFSAADGVAMGWLVAGCFVAAFSIKFIAHALRGETGGDYGSR